MRLPLALLLFATFAVAAPGSAQYGHPLKGSWSGDWGTSKDTRHRVLLDLHWDGKAITGTINPGTDSVRLTKATLDPATWTVTLEAEAKDEAGRAVSYRIQGTLSNLGSYNRLLTGTWHQDGVTGDFRLTRN
jgi:hypothetical protein